MEFDIISILIGFVGGVAAATVVGRAKFAILQREVRDLEQRLRDMTADAAASAKKVVRKVKKAL